MKKLRELMDEEKGFGESCNNNIEIE